MLPVLRLMSRKKGPPELFSVALLSGRTQHAWTVAPESVAQYTLSSMNLSDESIRFDQSVSV